MKMKKILVFLYKKIKVKLDKFFKFMTSVMRLGYPIIDKLIKS